MLQRMWRNLSKEKLALGNVRRRSRRLALEFLEDRCVPSATTWIGPENGLWSNAFNWTNGIPVNGSAVYFGSAAGGVNTDCVDDVNVTLNSLTIDASYGRSIALGGGKTLALAASGTASQASGTLGLNPGANFLNYGDYQWTGGSIIGGGTFVNEKYGNARFLNLATFDIADPAGNTLGVNVTNNGLINWSAGDIALSATITDNANRDLGGWNITAPNNTLNALPGGYLVHNSGSAITVATNGTVQFNVLFGSANINYGDIAVDSGSLEFQQATLFTNEGSVGIMNNGSGQNLAFAGAFSQIANSQNASVTPEIFGALGYTLSFGAGVEIGVGALGSAGSTISAGSLAVDSGGTVSLNSHMNVGADVSVSGILTVQEGQLTASSATINSGGVLNALIGAIIGPVTSYGTVNVPGSFTIEGGFTQGAGTTNLTTSGLPAASLTVTSDYVESAGTLAMGLSQLTVGGTFTVGHSAEVDIGLTVPTAGATFNCNVFIQSGGLLDFTVPDASVIFNGNLTLGDSNGAARIWEFVSNGANVNGTTNIISALFDFTHSGSPFQPEGPFTPWVFSGAVNYSTNPSTWTFSFPQPGNGHTFVVDVQPPPGTLPPPGGWVFRISAT
jgi:hypothetical protein